jgi:uncharacterized RDD family membrane protein YckC
MTAPEDPNQPQQPPSDATPPPPPPDPGYAAPPPPDPGYAAPPPPPQYAAPPPAYQGQPGYQVPGVLRNDYASWLQRVGGFLIDLLVMAVPGLVLVFLGVAIGHGFGVFLVFLGYLLWLVIGLWNLVFRQGRTGQSIGKQQLGLKLIRERDSEVLGAGFCFVRNLANILNSIACYIGYLWPLWDDKRQTFADKVCSTIVITV